MKVSGLASISLLIVGVLSLSTIYAQTDTSYKGKAEALKASIYLQLYDIKKGQFWETTPTEGKERRHAYLWPLCGMLQAANEYEILNGGTGMFDSIYTALRRYYDVSPPAPAYNSSIVKTKKEGRFYDDNQWLAIAFLSAYNRTRRSQYLEEAKAIYRFMMTGFDTVAGGGLYWKEGDKTTKNTCSNGPGVLVALGLYQYTKERGYLDTALLLYRWTKKTLQAPDHLFYDNLHLPQRKVDERKYTYNAGTMLQSAVQLFMLTEDSSYLNEAQACARSSLQRFFVNDAFPDNHWFNAVLMRGYVELYNVDKQSKYLEAMKAYANAVWNNDRNRTGLVGKKPEKSLLDQSGLLEILLRLGEWQKANP
jgi:Glycosyl hydrolase family 76